MQGIVSIQSQVVFGHVGNAMAQFALQRLGHEVWALPTVLFSNHPGHGGLTGAPTAPNALAQLVTGLERGGFLKGARAVISGYLGMPDQVPVVADAVARAREQTAADGLFYCCDPVMGDRGKGQYVREGIPEAIARDLLPLADMLTPNTFELALLSGRTVDTPEDAVRAARSLGVETVVVTSVPATGGTGGEPTIGTLAVTGEQAWLCVAPLLSRVPPGTGDLMTALLVGHRLNGHGLADALSLAASSLDRLLRAHNAAAGADDRSARELDLIAHQEALLPAAAHIEARPIAAPPLQA